MSRPLLLYSLFALVVSCRSEVLLAQGDISTAPYPPSRIFSGIEVDWSTHQRGAPGSDNFQLTWADDNHQYGAWGDGGGFGGSNSRGRVGLGIARVEGPASNFQGYNVWGGVNAESPATFNGKSWGMLCVDGRLLMWLVPDQPDGKPYRNHYEYIELCYSDDHGHRWQKCDWRFFQTEELTIPTFLNFGRDYSDVPDSLAGYVYAYFIRPASTSMEHQGPEGVGLIVHKPGKIFLARISRAAVRRGPQKAEVEFFRAFDSRNRPVWGSIADKQPVFEDPRGVGWCLSASFHPGRQRILLCTEHDRSQSGNLGIFEAPAPWGPWSTIEYFDKAHPFGKYREGSPHAWNNNVFFMAFPSKWISGDSVTITFTGAGQGKDNDSFNAVRGKLVAPPR